MNICETCNNEFKQKPNTTGKYCSPHCYQVTRKGVQRKKNEEKYNENPKKCNHCDNSLTYDQARQNNKYCSSSCASTINNKKFPKRRITRKCVECDNVVKSYRHDRCDVHWQKYKEFMKNSYKLKTVGEYRNLPSIRGKHPSWVHSHVRLFAKA